MSLTAQAATLALGQLATEPSVYQDGETVTQGSKGNGIYDLRNEG